LDAAPAPMVGSGSVVARGRPMWDRTPAGDKLVRAV